MCNQAFRRRLLRPAGGFDMAASWWQGVVTVVEMEHVNDGIGVT
ncbi:hypothetical protein [Rhizobium sp. RU20A]|nr:hypothetical protein [Rhizobium sp. RU20A]